MVDLLQANYAANEIMKVSDFNYGEDKGITNIDAVLGDLLSSTADVLGQGLTVVERSSPSMNVDIEAGWAFRVAGDAVVRSASAVGPVPVSAADPTQQRIDTLEIRRKITDFDTEQRAFKDPGTGTVSYQNHDTKSRYELEAQVVAGTPGSGVAPGHTTGWMKLAEIVVPAAATQILDANIKNVTAGKDGEANTAWTAETTSTYKLQRLSEIKTILRVKHSETGDHENDVIKGQHVDWGVGGEQVDGDLMPIGTAVSNTAVGTIPSTATVRSALQSLADAIDLPIGTIWIFDANNAGGGGSPSGASGAWVDDTTLPGWYACVSANADHGCPDMVDRFIMGKVAAGAGSTGGSNSKPIASANLPPHTHGSGTLATGNQSASHTHSGTTAIQSASHSHTIPVEVPESGLNYGNVAPGNGTAKGNITTSTQSASHTHTITTGTQSASHSHAISGSTSNGGFANTALDITPAHYTAIFIRKCA